MKQQNLIQSLRRTLVLHMRTMLRTSSQSCVERTRLLAEVVAREVESDIGDTDAPGSNEAIAAWLAANGNQDPSLASFVLAAFQASGLSSETALDASDGRDTAEAIHLRLGTPS